MLRMHLTMLRRREVIAEWLDRDIDAGTEWRDEIAAFTVTTLVRAQRIDPAVQVRDRV